MIKMSKPYLRTDKDTVFMECEFLYNNEKTTLYYATTPEYARYLSFERADAFLLGILLFAMRKGEDIVIDAPISEKLYYNLSTLVVPTFAVAYHYKKIKIRSSALDATVLKAEGEHNLSCAVGTGCSLGIDSLSTILYYTSDRVPKNYQITHLTFFNVGAHGNDVEKATISYNNDYSMIKEYADYKQMPLVTLSSNIGILYKGWNFDNCHLTRNIGAVLAFQKLFCHYVYASSHDISVLKLSDKATGYFETVIAPNLSTENTEVSIGLPDYTRTEKTRLVSEYPETYKTLYVCWKQILMNDYNGYSVNTESAKRNCGTCEKCKRTMLALDILKKKDCYEPVFDWGGYNKQRDALIGYALANKNRPGKSYWKDLCDLMDEENFVVPPKAKRYQRKFTILYKLGLPKMIKF